MSLRHPRAVGALAPVAAWQSTVTPGSQREVTSPIRHVLSAEEGVSTSTTGASFAGSHVLAVLTGVGTALSQHGRRLRRARAHAMRAGRASSEVVVQEEKDVAVASESDTVVMDGGVAAGSAAAPTLKPQSRPWFRMWTRADLWHVHAIAGTIEVAIGVVYLLDVVLGDVFQMLGLPWSAVTPMEAVYLSLALGAVNALSGMQPSLLPKPTDDLMQVLGLGKDGNLRAAGFVNTCVFYFILAHQCLRVSPDFPVWLQAWDPLFAGAAILGLFHAIFVIATWVQRGKLSAGFAFGMISTLCLNLPVSLHLLLEGQPWVEKLSAAYPGWPEVFFSANYALAWAGATVSLVLSLYERRVIDLTERLLLTLVIGAIVFGVIGLQAALLVPEWLNGQWMVMLTLTPPS